MEEFIKHLGTSEDAIKLEVSIEGKLVNMELDTGASVSLISEATWSTLYSKKKLENTATILRTYTGEKIQPLGSCSVEVKYNNKGATLPLLVIEGNGPNLLGRNWLPYIWIDLKSIHVVSNDKLQIILAKHQNVFGEGLGHLRGYHAKIHVEQEAVPKFMKARPVAYAMKEKIEKELDRLTSLGILEPIQFSEWASPIVPVLKSDRSVRICGDFKVTLNSVSKLDRHPIPRIEDLFARLGGGKLFSKLDMSQAYQQVELDDVSKQYTVINTHKGLFRYRRLPFGIASAPAIFQRVMESLLQNIPGVIVYIDHVLTKGKNDEEHLKSLEMVLKRIEDAGMLLKKEKCVFMAKSVSYLGHIIDSQGLHPTQDKVDVIQEAPSPNNLTQLKAYLGLLTYYGRFLPNISKHLFSLYRLLRKNTRWIWSKEEELAFQESKKLLTSSNLLVHFDPSLPLILSCDASMYRIGAVLAHHMSDGSEKPIGYVSRTLTQAEKHYSQLEKEGLACIFAVKKFHSYLFGHKFLMYTDNLSLKSLFNEKKPVPVQAAGRIQRWALALANYEYTMAFRPTHKHSNADALS